MLEAGPSRSMSDHRGEKRQRDDGSDSRSKRRDTDDRQRIEHSCDRCRLRKRRCLRARDDVPCLSCEEAGVECAMTLPRRQRIYATVDQLSLRYRVLDALINGLFPDREVGSLQGLIALAEEKGIEIPRTDGRIPPLNPTLNPTLSPEVDEEHTEPTRASPIQPPRSSSVEEVPEGWLVPAPKGGFHYVGTASLVYFAQTARTLVAKSHLATTPAFDDAGLRRFLGAAEFTTYKASHTIEAKIQGHPLTVAAEEQRDEAAELPCSPASSIKPPRLSDHLPDRLTCDRLVNAFFTRVHSNFAVFHRPTFVLKYEATFGQLGDPKLLSADAGWVSSLQIVLVLGAQVLETELGTRLYTLQQNILSYFFRECLERIILATSLSSVQALMLLALYQHNSGERNSAWLLLGHAARAAVGLGMHRDGEATRFDPFERQTRRLVWWTLHMFEGFVSLALGRPSFTDSVGTTVSFPDSTFTASLGHPDGLLEHMVRMSDLYTSVRRLVGTYSVLYDQAGEIERGCDAARSLLAEIGLWRSNLPVSLALSDEHRRPILLLHTWADYLESVATRPFHLARVNCALTNGHVPPDVSSLADTCVSAAESSVNHLLELATHGLLEGSVYLDFYTVQHAAMIISLHFLSRPSLLTSDVRLKTSTTELLSLAKAYNLAPTYRIIMNVAMQLAFIAGIGPTESVAAPVQDCVFSQLDVPLAHEDQIMPALEQLFGPMPPSRHNSAPDVFADLYNFGFDTSASNPWDIFDVGGLTETFLQQSESAGQNL